MTEPELHPPEVFKQYSPETEGILHDLEKKAQEEDIPIIGPHVGKILNLLINISGACRILELGTANAYSTIWMAQALDNHEVKEIITLEWDPEMATEARKNIDRAGYSGLVEVVQGDARDYLSSLKESEKFDLVFLDVEKEYYSDLLDPVIHMTRPGGLLVFDNTAFRSAGDFLRRSYDHPQLETIHLYGFYPDHNPDFDALTLCVKK